MAFLTGYDVWLVLSIAVVTATLLDIGRVRGLSAGAAVGWVLLVVLVPVAGPALWFVVARPRLRAGSVRDRSG